MKWLPCFIVVFAFASLCRASGNGREGYNRRVARTGYELPPGGYPANNQVQGNERAIIYGQPVAGLAHIPAEPIPGTLAYYQQRGAPEPLPEYPTVDHLSRFDERRSTRERAVEGQRRRRERERMALMNVLDMANQMRNMQIQGGGGGGGDGGQEEGFMHPLQRNYMRQGGDEDAASSSAMPDRASRRRQQRRGEGGEQQSAAEPQTARVGSGRAQQRLLAREAQRRAAAFAQPPAEVVAAEPAIDHGRFDRQIDFALENKGVFIGMPERELAAAVMEISLEMGEQAHVGENVAERVYNVGINVGREYYYEYVRQYGNFFSMVEALKEQLNNAGVTDAHLRSQFLLSNFRQIRENDQRGSGGGGHSEGSGSD